MLRLGPEKCVRRMRLPQTRSTQGTQDYERDIRSYICLQVMIFLIKGVNVDAGSNQDSRCMYLCLNFYLTFLENEILANNPLPHVMNVLNDSLEVGCCVV